MVLRHIAFSIYVCVAELLFSDGYAAVLVGMPEEFAPVAATRVERTAVVENIALRCDTLQNQCDDSAGSLFATSGETRPVIEIDDAKRTVALDNRIATVDVLDIRPIESTVVSGGTSCMVVSSSSLTNSATYPLDRNRRTTACMMALSFSTELGENSFALNMANIFIFQEMLLLWQYR